MSATDALPWTEVENALARWAYKSAGIDPARVRVVSPRSLGEARGPAPKVTISLLSLLPLSQVGESTLRLVMQQRYSIVAGAGEVGVDFYPGYSFTPQRISVAAAANDAPSATAQALLAQLQADLPVPFTAELGSASVELELAGAPGVQVPKGSQVTLDSNPAFAWTLKEDVYLPGTGTFVYSQPGGTAAALESWSIAGTTVGGWNEVKPNAAAAAEATSVVVKGAASAPLFASSPADRDLLEVSDIVSRYTIFSRVEVLVVWRIDYRADGVSGSGRATAAASHAVLFRRALLDGPMEQLGFRPMGTANFASELALDRDESLATLDVRFQGIMTGVRTATPMRRTRIVGTVKLV